jgi:general secretion pathway protein B
MSFILEALKKSERERRLGNVPSLDTEHRSKQATPARRLWPWLVVLVVNGLVLTVLWYSYSVGPGEGTPASVSAIPSPISLPSATFTSPREHTATLGTARIAPSLYATAPPRPAPRERAKRLPALTDLPATFRQGLPPLRINVHVYDDKPAARFVLIDMHRYREGETLEGGLTLERITPDGVVLRKGGERFQVGR